MIVSSLNWLCLNPNFCANQLNYMWLVNEALCASVSPENEMCVILV